MVLKQGLLLAGTGVVLGLVAAFGLSRLMEALLFGVDPVDLPTFATMAVSLTAVALLASYVPAHRASRTDPVVAIRAEL
jgi:ABC-type antimicrobial peptide transport system permease subunit